MKRKEVNKKIVQDIAEYFKDRPEVKEWGMKLNHEMNLFLEREEQKIQVYAHKMIPDESKGLSNHADRWDLKRSLRKHASSALIYFLGLNSQGIKPNDEETKNE